MSPGEPSQQAVMDFLADPATHGGAEVTRIDTHAASVFLAGDRALKIKRAVRFPFLDYSTLAKRKAACEAEIAVNRPFAPAIYRGVVAITRAARRRASPWAARASRWNGRWRCAASTRMRRSIIWPSAARSTTRLPTRSAARWRRRMRPPPRQADFGFAETLAEIVAQNESRARRTARPVRAAAGRGARQGDARGACAPAPAARGARARRAGQALPRRPASRQYRAARRRADAVRRHRVRSQHRHRRRVLRSRLPAHGPDRARLARARPISCSTAISPRRAGPTISTRWPRCRCSCRCAPPSAPRSPPRAPG